MSRQTQHKVEVKYVMKKKSIVVTKYDKNCKMNVATQKSMLRHNEKLKAKFSVTRMIKKWQQSFVSIIKFMSRQ